MMDVPLTTWLLFDGAATHHRHADVVSRLPSGHIHRYTFGDFADRTSICATRTGGAAGSSSASAAVPSCEDCPDHVASVRRLFFDRLDSAAIEALRKLVHAVGSPIARYEADRDGLQHSTKR
jgi:hypothetical protein